MKKGKFLYVCECGKPMYELLNENGIKIGVTHEEWDDEHHCKYFTCSIPITINLN